MIQFLSLFFPSLHNSDWDASRSLSNVYRESGSSCTSGVKVMSTSAPTVNHRMLTAMKDLTRSSGLDLDIARSVDWGLLLLPVTLQSSLCARDMTVPDARVSLLQ